MSSIEEDFKKAQEKLNAAAALLKEANEFAQKHDTNLRNFSLFDEDDIDGIYNDLDTHSFVNALSNAGWSTSSMNC